MKLKKLLVLGAALFVTGAVSAGITERQKPVFELQTPVEAPTDGTTYVYMYNVGAKKFFTGANYWGTHASVGEFEAAYKVTFKQHLVDGAWDGATVEFLDTCKAKSNAIKNVFIDNAEGGVYVDRGNQANIYWNIAKNVDNAYYRLSMGVTSPDYASWQELNPDTYLGNNDTLKTGEGANNATPGSTTLVLAFMNPKDPNTGELNPHVHVDWAFVSSEEGAAFQAQLDIYNAAETLKGVIADAEAKGLSVADAEAVYNNASATLADIKAATTALQAAIDAIVDPNNPVDKTYLIVNPDYSNGKADWSDTNSDWAVSYNVAEHYDDEFEHSQKIKGVAPGVYAVTLRGYSRPSSSGAAWDYYTQGKAHELFLFADNGIDTLTANMPNIWAGRSEAELGVGSVSTITDADGVTWYVTNDMQGAEAYFNDEVLGPKYDRVLFFSVESDSMRIGIKQEAKIGADWALWDNWRLHYYGSKPEAYAMWLENLKANAPQFAEDIVVTAGMVEEYTAFVAGLTGSDYATVATAAREIDEKVAAVEANMAVWAEFTALMEKGNAMVTNPELDQDCEYLQYLGEYVEMDGADIYDALELTTEEVEAEIAKLEELIHAASTKCLMLNADVTDMFLTNYNFDDASDGKNDGRGWEGSWGAISSSCMESYDITWDVHQVVKDAPVGIYEISFQGFFRTQRDEDAYQLYVNGGQVSPGWLYVNSKTNPFKCVFDEPQAAGFYPSGSMTPSDGNEYPNDMTSAGYAFGQGMYMSTANGLVAKAGDELRIGTKGSLSGGTWAIWDSFKMIYRGKQAEYVTEYLNAAIAEADQHLEGHIGKEVKELVEASKAAGEAALAGDDGDAMFDALVALYALGDTATVSAAAIEVVYNDAQNLFSDIESAVAGAAVQTEAATLAETIIMGIDECSYTTAEMAGLTAQIKAMRLKLITPDGVATDDAPFDFTKAIMTPSFEKDGANAIDGWQGTSGYNFGNDNTQKGALAVEFYEKTLDMYQELTGLQDGTYRVEVSAFSRAGSTENDFAMTAAGTPVPNSNGCLYAVSGGVEYSTPLALLSSSALTEDPGVGGNYTDELGNVYYVPGDMVSAKSFFEDGYYKNVLYVNVTEGALRIGIKKTEKVTYDWVIMDDFKLYYHGTESQYKDAANVEEVLGAAQVVAVEYYNANGVQQSSLQKGFNIIKTTYENGAVVVSKKFVK